MTSFNEVLAVIIGLAIFFIGLWVAYLFGKDFEKSRNWLLGKIFNPGSKPKKKKLKRMS